MNPATSAYTATPAKRSVFLRLFRFTWGTWRLTCKVVGATILIGLGILYSLGIFAGNLSVGEVSNRLYQMSPMEVSEGLEQLARAKGWVRDAKFPTAQPPAGTRDERWKQDLDYLMESIKRVHAVAWYYITPEKFEKEIQSLKSNVATMTDRNIACEVSRILALIGDGHTGIGTSDTTFPFRELPIRVRYFPDGYFVVAAGLKHRNLIGKQLVSIHGIAIDEVAERVRPYFSAENRYAEISNVESAIRHVDFLVAAGVADSNERVRLSLLDSKAAAVEIEIESSEDKTDLNAWAQPKLLPRYLSNMKSDYWFSGTEDGLFVLRYNRCNGHQKFSELTQEMTQAIQQQRPPKIVVDLRRNGGGDSSVIDPFLKVLQEQGYVVRGRLFVLTDRETFSSGFHNLLSLRKLNAIHVGEAPSQKLNYGGNIRSFKLPNTGVRVAYPTQDSAWLKGIDIRVVEPEHIVIPTGTDHFQGLDPVMEFVKKSR